jgi:hypothetical protein
MTSIVEVRDKLRRLDVLSGLWGARPQAELSAICHDLAFNDVAGLLAVAEAAELLIAAPHCERPIASFGHEKCTSAGDACEVHRWHVLRHSLTLMGHS